MVTVNQGDEPRRVRLPCEWESLPNTPAGPVRFCRRFHTPTGLSEASRLYVETTAALQSARCDGLELAVAASPSADGTVRYVFKRLADGAHELELIVTGPPGLVDPVYLVIEESSGIE